MTSVATRTPSPFGLHRVLEPAGVLPQAALRLDTDPRIAPAVAWLLGKQDGAGRWRNEHAWNGKTWTDIERQGEAPLDLLGRQRPGPPCIPAGDDELRDGFRMAQSQLECERASERVTYDVGGAQFEPRDEAGQHIGVISESKRLRRILRPAAPGSIPGDDCELVRQRVDLWLPDTTVADRAVYEDHWRTVPGPLEGDPEPAGLDRRHGGQALPIPTESRHEKALFPGLSAGGRCVARTRDLLLVRQALSQLS